MLVQQLVDDIVASAIPLPNNVAASENLLRLPCPALIHGRKARQRLAFYHAYGRKSVASAQSVNHKKCAQQSQVTQSPPFLVRKMQHLCVAISQQ